MFAVLRHRFGSPDVLRVEDIAMPEPATGEVRVRVRASAVNALDRGLMSGLPYLGRLMFWPLLMRTPRVGAALAGVVDAVGAGATRFKPGDAVFGSQLGAFAEFVCASEDKLAPMPMALSFEQAAALPVAAITAYQGLKDRVMPGMSVLVTGAAGGVGHFAVQLAKHWGATVTASCHRDCLDLMPTFRADRALDYSAPDYAARLGEYDLIFDVAGNAPLSFSLAHLAPGGQYLIAGAPAGRWVAPFDRMIATLFRSLVSRQRIRIVQARASSTDLAALAVLANAGALKPAIDSRYPLRDIAEAMRRFERGHLRGKVVITVEHTA